jgi:hypothetical protein
MTGRLLRFLLAASALLAALIASACAAPAPALAPTPGSVATAAPPTHQPAVESPVPTSAPTAAPTHSRPTEAGGQGAAVPWIEYEAEQGQTSGLVLEPSREFGQVAAEASGRSAVQLAAEGQFVEFQAAQAANSIVVRYAMPDAPGGGGITATLSLYVDGAMRQKLRLTSRFAWSYGGADKTLNDPGAGGAHHFFDEARALVEPIPAGASVRLQKDADDVAEYYVIDLVDLEQVAPPAAMPDGFISIGECGATPDDGRDDGDAIQNCLDRARLESKGVWIPPGVFESSSPTRSPKGIPMVGVSIRGAGMWHSTIHGPYARFFCAGSGCGFADFAILGETTTRDDEIPDSGFNGAAGTGSRMERVWVEHTKAGWWVGAGAQNVTDGLVITGSRFRNLFADGVNLCNGARNSVVEQSHFRNTGDDALASWAPSFDGDANANNVFRFNSVQLPWRANCYAIYGGRDNRIEDSTCADVVTYPGILIAQQFKAWPFEGTTTVERVSLIRAGGPMWGERHGALKLLASEGDLSGVAVRDLLIDSPTFSGVQIDGPHRLAGVIFDNVRIVGPATYGIEVRATGAGSGAIFNAVSVSGAIEGGLHGAPPGGPFSLTRGLGNSGW